MVFIRDLENLTVILEVSYGFSGQDIINTCTIG